MIDPQRLLMHTHDLLAPKKGAPNQSDLRRAVSSAYYALFHHLLRAASDQMVGSSPAQRRRPEYRLVYRSLQHTSMADVCEAVRRPTLSGRYQRARGLVDFGPDIKKCAATFADLQRVRHTADYDPGQRFTKAEAAAVVATSEFAISSFDAAAEAERRVFIHLLTFKVRD